MTCYSLWLFAEQDGVLLETSFLVLVDIIQQSICNCLKLSESGCALDCFPMALLGGVGFAEEVVQQNVEAVKGGWIGILPRTRIKFLCKIKTTGLPKSGGC